MFLRNERSLEVKNGTLGTIERVSESNMAVRTDDGRSVTFDIKDYRDFDHGYAATIHKAQGMTVDRTHVLATPGMDRHGAYVAMSRHRDGVALHYGRDDFKDQSRFVRTLSRERPKDMASDYERRDPARDFAERRGISFRERIAEIVKAIPEKARGIFDNFRPTAEPPRERDMFASFRPAPRLHVPERSDQLARSPQPTSASGLRRAGGRYARALDPLRENRARGPAPRTHTRPRRDRAEATIHATQTKSYP